MDDMSRSLADAASGANRRAPALLGYFSRFRAKGGLQGVAQRSVHRQTASFFDKTGRFLRPRIAVASELLADEKKRIHVVAIKGIGRGLGKAAGNGQETGRWQLSMLITRIECCVRVTPASGALSFVEERMACSNRQTIGNAGFQAPRVEPPSITRSCIVIWPA